MLESLDVCRVTRYVLESVRPLGGWGVSLTRFVLESVGSFVGLGVYLTRLYYNMSDRSSDGESVLHALLLILSH